MNLTVAGLIGALGVWMLGCAYQGYRARFVGFLGVLLVGLALNTLWMALHLNAHPLELNAIVAQIALMLYGVCAFGFGWLAGRLVRQLRASRVDDQPV
jgi:hypothetical protein